VGCFCWLPALFQGDEGVAARYERLEDMPKDLPQPVVRDVDQGARQHKGIHVFSGEIAGEGETDAVLDQPAEKWVFPVKGQLGFGGEGVVGFIA